MKILGDEERAIGLDSQPDSGKRISKKKTTTVPSTEGSIPPSSEKSDFTGLTSSSPFKIVCNTSLKFQKIIFIF